MEQPLLLRERPARLELLQREAQQSQPLFVQLPATRALQAEELREL